MNAEQYLFNIPIYVKSYEKKKSIILKYVKFFNMFSIDIDLFLDKLLDVCDNCCTFC